jgi:hypothetical protein
MQKILKPEQTVMLSDGEFIHNHTKQTLIAGSWQPIETAPSSGQVLVNVNISGTNFTKIGQIIEDRWHTSDGCIWKPGFVTHWMALPELN